MPTMRMTARGVEAIKPPASDREEYWDEQEPKGLGLRVSSSGRKTWVLMYRAGGRLRRMTLGVYPSLSLGDAREMAHDLLRKVAKGGDPGADKQADRRAETFGELAALYVERHAKREKRSWKKDEWILNKDLLPRFRCRKAKDIKKADIIAMLDDIVERGAPIQANRTLALVRKIYNWALGRDLLDTNPCLGISRPASENSRARVLTEDEIRSIWTAMEQEDALNAAPFKLRLLTAQRAQEVLAMRWDQIADNWWTIPAAVAKNGIEHRVPITRQVQKVLDDVRPLGGGSPWVFPGSGESGHVVALHKTHVRIRQRADIQDYQPHDLRRTAASYMTGMGFERLVVKKILNHVESDVTAVYDRHSYDREKRQALEAWNERLDRILAGEDTVVALARRR